jgi:hypothetical protein
LDGFFNRHLRVPFFMGDAGWSDNRRPVFTSSMKGSPAHMPDDAGLAACATLADPKSAASAAARLSILKKRLE